ncbi:hypothetical protein AWV79_09255 [Cupriavidus sp. UYMMa02A]|nr:hypothetical protein AWV79_09255 [Cupriavidus sp. UYMMa02A]
MALLAQAFVDRVQFGIGPAHVAAVSTTADTMMPTPTGMPSVMTPPPSGVPSAAGANASSRMKPK